LIQSDELKNRESLSVVGPIKLIYVSIVNQYKHQWHVVEAVAMARKATGLNLQIDLVGPAYGPALNRLNVAIARHDPMGEWVIYRGAIDYEELHEIYAKAAIGIFASSCENMPNILLEMMAVGLLVLSSDRGPMPEILGDAGLYFDPEKPISLATILTEVLSLNGQVKDISLAARDKALTYSWERCATETFGFLRSVVRGSKEIS
jgi:glycosyltransferase involved in cell wall biosynthesis